MGIQVEEYKQNYEKILTVIFKIIIFKDRKTIIIKALKSYYCFQNPNYFILNILRIRIELSLPSSNKFHSLPYGQYYIHNLFCHCCCMIQPKLCIRCFQLLSMYHSLILGSLCLTI